MIKCPQCKRYDKVKISRDMNNDLYLECSRCNTKVKIEKESTKYPKVGVAPRPEHSSSDSNVSASEAGGSNPPPYTFIQKIKRWFSG